jgi:hypothetical protein
MTIKNERFKQLSEQLRQELSAAYFQSMIQGSMNPLVEFYRANELALAKEYHISLNNVLGITQDDMDRVGAFNINNYYQNQQLPQPQIENETNSLLNDNQKDFFERTILPFVGIACVSYGIYLITKSLK